jgi:hypothetical protein
MEKTKKALNIEAESLEETVHSLKQCNENEVLTFQQEVDRLSSQNKRLEDKVQDNETIICDLQERLKDSEKLPESLSRSTNDEVQRLDPSTSSDEEQEQNQVDIPIAASTSRRQQSNKTNEEKKFRKTSDGKSQCLICLKKTHQIKRHLQSHNHKCEKCGTKFEGDRASRSLKRHIAICKGPKEKRCKRCLKTFEYQSVMLIHQKKCKASPK